MSADPEGPQGDVEPLPQAPPEDVQRAQAERLLRAWKIPDGWRYWSCVNNVEAFNEVADPILARQHGVRALGADGLHPAVS